MKYYKFIRDVDIAKVSGTGHVATVVELNDGQAAITWHVPGTVGASTPYPNLNDLMKIHCHEGLSHLEPVEYGEGINTDLNAILEKIHDDFYDFLQAFRLEIGLDY